MGPLPGPLDSRPDNEVFLPLALIIAKDDRHRESGYNSQLHFNVGTIGTWMERGRNSPSGCPPSSELNLEGA